MPRALAAPDRPAWQALWQGYQRFYGVDLAAGADALWQRLLDPAEPIHGAVAEHGGDMIGLVHWVEMRTTWSVRNSIYLQDLFVAEGSRGSGAGRALIAHVVADAAARGCGEVDWLTHTDNTTARRLYDRVAAFEGFVQYRIECP